MSRPDAIVVMGVCGSGKSTVGRLLAAELGWPFVDSDDLHAADAVAQMRSGTPLNDAQRLPWLQRIGEQIDAWRTSRASGVVACSALKRSYRDALAHGRDVRYVYLRGSEALIRARMSARSRHFMPESLLASQLATLEEPRADERAITVSIGSEPAHMVKEIRQQLAL